MKEEYKDFSGDQRWKRSAEGIKVNRGEGRVQGVYR